MDRNTKELQVVALGDIFKSAQAGYLVDFRGLTVEEATDLRRKLRDAQAQMRVLKNNLAKIAIKGTPFEVLSDDIIDTRALIYSDDPVSPARVVSEYGAKSDHFSFISGLLVKGADGQQLDESTIKFLATLPTRDQLIGQFLSVLQATQTKLVRTLNEVPASFARTLSALAESRGES